MKDDAYDVARAYVAESYSFKEKPFAEANKHFINYFFIVRNQFLSVAY
jgi:hypothetical protein